MKQQRNNFAESVLVDGHSQKLDRTIEARQEHGIPNTKPRTKTRSRNTKRGFQSRVKR